VDNDARHVPFEACFNFRDIGGYETAAGRYVRWGAVFRSGSLHRLTAADRETAARLGLRTVIDLRSATELRREGRFHGSDEVAFHHLPLEDESATKEDGTPEPRELSLGETYVEIAVTGRHAVANVLRVVAEDPHPVVIHCFAGKDRTGVIAALILSSLGVSDAMISADYQLSEHALAPAVAWAEANDPEWATLMSTLPPHVLRASPSSMPVFLDTLRARYGSIDDYLVHAGLDRRHLDLLRTRLLVEPPEGLPDTG
jgi:protein tyrosine/serine phosphatase